MANVWRSAWGWVGSSDRRSITRRISLGVIGLSLPVTYGLALAAVSDWRGVFIGLGALGLALSKRVPVIWILAAGGLAGYLLYGL